jgi:hypothetical protein
MKRTTHLPGLPAQSRQVRATRPAMQLWFDIIVSPDFSGGLEGDDLGSEKGARVIAEVEIRGNNAREY